MAPSSERRQTTLKAAQAQLEQAQLALQGNQAGYARWWPMCRAWSRPSRPSRARWSPAGTPVVRIAQDGPRDVVFSVPEDKVAAMAGPRWTCGSGPSQTLSGKVREVAASADPVTRTFPVKVSLDGRTPPLGATVYVAPRAAGHAGVRRDQAAHQRAAPGGQGTAVWVLDKTSMTVRSQPVQIATADGNEVVVAAGLRPACRWWHRRACAATGAEGHGLSSQNRAAAPVAEAAQAATKIRQRLRPAAAAIPAK